MSESTSTSGETGGDPDAAGVGIREAFVAFDRYDLDAIGVEDLLSVAREAGLRHVEIL